jgi:hypothetical protein
MNSSHEARRLNSGIAIQECIHALTQSWSQFLEAEATFTSDEQVGLRGNIRFVFDSTNLSEFPILSFDQHLIRGFGIPHESFNPNLGDEFTFDPNTMTLRVVSGRYRFSLSDIRPL